MVRIITILFTILSFTSQLGSIAHQIKVDTANSLYSEDYYLDTTINPAAIYSTEWITQEDQPGTLESPKSPCYRLPRSRDSKTYEDDVVTSIYLKQDKSVKTESNSNTGSAPIKYILLFREARTDGYLGLKALANKAAEKLSKFSGIDFDYCQGPLYEIAKWPYSDYDVPSANARLPRSKLGKYSNIVAYKIVYEFRDSSWRSSAPQTLMSIFAKYKSCTKNGGAYVVDMLSGLTKYASELYGKLEPQPTIFLKHVCTLGRWGDSAKIN